MKDNNKRKDRIKNITIVFLGVMLVLTLFSNTIMNYSLVEVSTQQIMSDSLTTKVRGTGTVEASEGYSVTVPESRKIATVDVKTGDEVAKDTVLFTLEDAESEELKTQKEALENAKKEYDTAVLQAGITVSERTAIEGGGGQSLSQMQNAIVAAKQNVDSLQSKVNSLTTQAVSSSSVDTSSEQAALIKAQQDKIAKQSEVDAASAELTSAQSAYDDAKTNPEADAATVAAAKNVYDAARAKYVSAQQALVPYEAAETNAQNALNAKLSSDEGTNSSTELTNAQAELERAQAEYEKTSTDMVNKINVKYQFEALQEIQKQVDELTGNAIDAQIKSPIAGVVTDIMYTAGQTVQAEEVLMTIQPENKAFTLSFEVTAEQSKKIKIGDDAKVLNNWSGDDIKATVFSIKKNKDNPKNVTVSCAMSGEVRVGETYTLSIGEKSSSYECIVPTSCIREDSNGSFVLVLESKSTPLGNRYYARRYDVEVLAADDNNSAVSGAFEGYEFVITTTSKPVDINQQVRLAE
ncbi:MAG: HlyD family efflux transporter periplasmic adaptor subunit [Agathobacter sp.]|nr:HlyD family efflux transporter periplasmic adaptor subunit [Agathobacter sp.]